uniref:Bet v I/Major latex protein domain-containing protein n=1 Tax=Chenopodium quinoa TaxID=63459 RepID=A0A803NEL5_CHEQI
MAQLRSVEGQVELKCHADNFFDVWAGKAHLISKISPNKIAKVELVEGEWNKVGAVISWTYLIVTTSPSSPRWKSFHGEGCIMKWSIEYEKMNEDAAEPKMHVALSLELAKEIDAHGCSA